MRILIVGAGSIGRLFGALLGKSGIDVTLLEKKTDVVNAIAQQGIGLLQLNEANPDLVSHVKVTVTDTAPGLAPFDLVLIAVKSSDTLAAIKSASQFIDDHCPVLSIQTGLGNVEIMEQVVANKHILAGFTLMSGAALGDNHVRHGGSGVTAFGELDGSVSERALKIARTFEAAGIETHVVPDILSQLWKKVIVYSAINPVSAILKVQNGRLLENMESISLMKRLIDEAKWVAEANSINLSGANLYDMLFDACKRTATTISSMLQDVLNGKSTEIDAQNGYFCKIAREKGRSLPVHETIVELIKLLEKLPSTVC